MNIHSLLDFSYTQFTWDLRESKGKDKKDGQLGIGLVKPCISTWGPKALSNIQPGCHEDFDFAAYTYITVTRGGGKGWGTRRGGGGGV